MANLESTNTCPLRGGSCDPACALAIHHAPKQGLWMCAVAAIAQQMSTRGHEEGPLYEAQEVGMA